MTGIDFTVEIEDPDFNNGKRIRLSDEPGWKSGLKSRAHCRRFARQLVFEGIAMADVVQVSTSEVVCSYTPDNAPVAKMGPDGICPLRSRPRKKNA